MITLTFQCGGCDAKVEGAGPLRSEFKSFTGRSWGFGGRVETTTTQSVTPQGWIAFDPYTGCTYCPKCWAEITEESATQGEGRDA